MKLHELQPAAGSKKTRTRVGRGLGSGLGKTSGRGQKGQEHGRLLSRRALLRAAGSDGHRLRDHHRRQRPDGACGCRGFKRLQGHHDGAAVPAWDVHLFRPRRAHLGRRHKVRRHIHPGPV